VLASQFNQDTLMKMANMKLPTQAELDQQALQQQIEAMKQQALAQQQQAMMGHNGGPPVGGPQQPPAPVPPGQPAPMGVMQ
jgi:hypothetical protein